MSKKKIKIAIIYSLKVLIGLIITSPVLLALSYSFMNEVDLYKYPPVWLPNPLILDNYAWVLAKIPIARYFGNTMIVCVTVILSQILLASFAAYSFSFFRYPGKKLFFSLILSTMMIPGDVVIITNYIQIQKWGLVDTYLGLTITSLISGMAIFLMRQYYLTLPKEIKEASVIDGCGDMAFLFRIAMPLSIPVMTSLGIYLFILTYNQYFWPLLVTNKDTMRTIQIGMAMLKGSEHTEYGNVLAGAMLCIVPAVLVFIIGQDYLIKGMTSGSVKG